MTSMANAGERTVRLLYHDQQRNTMEPHVLEWVRRYSRYDGLGGVYEVERLA